MKTKIKFLAMMLMGVLLSTNVWGDGRVEINTENSEVKGSYNSGTITIDGYDFYVNNWMKNNNIQAKASQSGSLYNQDPMPGNIAKVIVYQTGTARAVTMKGSNYYDEDEAEEAGDEYIEENIASPATAAKMEFSFAGKEFPYFYMSTPGNAVYMDSVVIYYSTTPVVKRSVAWMVNGSSYSIGNPTIEVADGGKVTTLPTAPTIDCGGKLFAGWTDHVVTDGAKPTPLFVTTDDAPTVTGADVTYYAVFADASGSGEVTYTKLSSNSFDATATYVLAAEESGTSSTLHYFSSYTTTEPNENWGVTSTTASDAITFTLGGTASALTAQDASDNYIAALATGKFKMSSTSTTLNLHDDGTIYNPTSGSTGYRLRYNHNNGSGGFRWYNSETGTSAYFYKVEGGYSFSNYTTTCTSCTPAGTALAVSASPASITTSETSTLSTTGGNGGEVTYSVTSANASNAHIDGTTFSASVVGTYTITAHQNMNGDVCEQNATVNIEVTPAKHEVRWHVGGVVTTDEVAEGASITFPEAPSAPTACDEKSFYGWAKSEIVVETDDAPTVYTSETMSTADIDFYAVFADKEGSDPTLTKLGGSTTFTAGENIVVVASGDSWSRILYQETANTSYVNSKVVGTGAGEVALTAQGISADVKNYWTLSAGSNGTWILGDATNGYLLQKTSANEMYAAVSVPDVTTTNQWTIAWDETNSKFTLKAGKYLCCRSDLSDSYKYKWRGNGIAISENGVYYCDIYKLDGGGVTYSNYVTSCATYTVTFKSNGAVVKTVSDVAPGQQVTAPTLEEIKSNPGGDANACSEYLIGWSSQPVYRNASAAPSDLQQGEITIPNDITSDVTYHAVYADVDVAGE